MKKLILAALVSAIFAPSVFAANVDIPALPAASSAAGTDLAECSQSGTSRKCTVDQIKTYTNTSCVVAHTTTTEVVASSSQNCLNTFSNGSATAASIAQATGSFGAGWVTSLKNNGVGTVTLTPTTSTVDGSATLVLTTGQGVDLYSNGANYFTQPGKGGGGTVTTTGSPANGNLTQFSGASSITNGNLSGNCVTSGTLATNCDVPHPGYIATAWYQPGGYARRLVAATGTASANRIICKYGYVSVKLTIGALGARVNATGSTNFQLAIYASSSGRPGALIGNTGNIVNTAAAAATGALAANKQVGPGGTDGGRDIWWCFNNGDATATFFSPDQQDLAQNEYIGSTTAGDLFQSSTSAQEALSCSGAACNGGSSTLGTWPATLAGTTWSSNQANSTGNQMPLVIFQAASVP